MIHKISLGNRVIQYTLKRSKRKTMGIEVNPQGALLVTAPDYIPIEKIEWALGKRQKWIFEKIDEKSQNLQLQPKRNYESGESLYLFGRQYYLKVISSDRNKIEIEGSRIHAEITPTPDRKTIIEEWLYARLAEEVSKLSVSCTERFLDSFNLAKRPQFKIVPMKRRWGSCSSVGNIRLNTALVAAPVECIEYVIYHELVHLLHPNHSEEFYRALKKLCPKYEALKKQLDDKTVIYED